MWNSRSACLLRPFSLHFGRRYGTRASEKVTKVAASGGTGFMQRVSRALQYLKENRARLFWAWVAYQSIKGLVTLSFIWIPLFLWLRS